MDADEQAAPLRLEDLRGAINTVLDAAVARFGPTVDLDDAGPYWHLPWDTAYAVDDDAGLRLDLGDTVADDLPAMREVLRAGAEDTQPLDFALGRLAELLRWLAFQDAPRERRERRDSVTDAEVLRLLRKQWTAVPHSGNGRRAGRADQE